MKLHKEHEFLRWAKQKGMMLDPQYPDSAELTFEPAPEEEDRFWVVPSEPERRPYFIASLLELAGEWGSFLCWRHLGSWPKSPDPDRLNDRIEYKILSGVGLALGTPEIVEFDRSEIDSLITLVFSTTVFGWSVGEDLYLVPDHGRHIIQTDHHGVIHVSCRSQEEIQRFITGMTEKGFRLPDEVPDPTFKRPPWMGRS